MRQRHLYIIFIALILSLLAYSSLVLLAKPPVAVASAYVIGSDPVDGSTIASVPQEVHIHFNAAISILSSAHVFVVQKGTHNSSLVEAGANTGFVSESSPNELIIPLGQAQNLPQGSYLVRWAAVANNDGRTTFGNIGFNVGISSTGLSGTPILGPGTSNQLDEIRALDTSHAPNILAVVWEWLMMAALTLWIGKLVMEQFVLSDGDRCAELHIHIKKRANSLQRLYLYALLFSEIVSLVLRTTSIVENVHINSSYLSTLQSLLLDTNYGHLWLARFALILMAMGLVYRTNRSGTKRVDIGGTAGLVLSLLGKSHIPSVPQTGTSRQTPPLSEEKSANSVAQTVRPAAAPARTRTGARAGARTGARTGTVGTVPNASSARHRVDARHDPYSSASPVPTENPPISAITKENRYPTAWLFLSGLILLLQVLSRAPAQTFQPHMSAIIFDWLNLAALGIWFGSFVYLGYLILPLFSSKKLNYQTETLTTILRRLLPFVLAAIGIEIVSTLFLSEAALGRVQQLISDPYGRTLLIQIVILVIMLTLSLYVLLDREKPLSLRSKLKRQMLLLPLVHTDLPVRRRRQSELQQTKKSLGITCTIITWLGAGLLLCMALMTFFTPPIHFPAVASSNPSTGSVNTTNVQMKQIGDLSVSLQLLPGRSDKDNTLILILSEDNGKIVTNAQLHLKTNMQAMDMGTGDILIPGASPEATSGNPAYITTIDKGATFNMAGLWVITVEIERPNQNAVQGTFQVMVS